MPFPTCYRLVSVLVAFRFLLLAVSLAPTRCWQTPPREQWHASTDWKLRFALVRSSSYAAIDARTSQWLCQTSDLRRRCSQVIG